VRGAGAGPALTTKTNNMQTAVEWLANEISYQLGTNDLLEGLYKQAKQMEKEQMENMFFVGGQNGHLSCEGKPFETFEKYYNKTYGK
jgi:hypothetical protein